MARLIAVNSVTLDGVTQGLGRPDEDTRGGFEHGGWGVPYADQVIGEEMGRQMATTAGILLGRRTYEDLYSYWPNQPDNPYTDVLTSTSKYVVSSSLDEPLPWENSILVTGDPVHAVAELKDEIDASLAIIGSGELVRSLVPASLIDEYLLLIHPLVLGQGRRLFADQGPRVDLTLTHSVVSSTGVIVATYRPV